MVIPDLKLSSKMSVAKRGTGWPYSKVVIFSMIPLLRHTGGVQRESNIRSRKSFCLWPIRGICKQLAKPVANMSKQMEWWGTQFGHGGGITASFGGLSDMN